MDEKFKPVLASKGNVLGGILILLGIIFLLGQVFEFNLSWYLWPFMVIIPGVLIFLLALSVDESAGKGLAIAGSIVTMVGLILLAQTFSDHWVSWTYAWALVAPTSAGLGLWLFGSIKNQEDALKAGKDLTRVGLIIFVVAAIFFEFVMGFSGYGVGQYIVPLLLILVGFFFLLRNLRSGRQEG